LDHRAKAVPLEEMELTVIPDPADLPDLLEILAFGVLLEMKASLEQPVQCPELKQVILPHSNITKEWEAGGH